MKKLPPILGVWTLLLLASCGDREADGNDAASPANGLVAEGAKDVPATAVATARLTGLYEGGAAARKHQLCIIDKGSGDAQFGLVVWGERDMSCSGAGQAARSGDRLTLTMSGDRTCTIEARMVGDEVTLPAAVPEGCSYYCAQGAKLSSVRFARTGSTAADAMKAKDLADDPLCG